MLSRRPQDRPSLEEVLSHPWMDSTPSASPSRPSRPLQREVGGSSVPTSYLISNSSLPAPSSPPSPSSPPRLSPNPSKALFVSKPSCQPHSNSHSSHPRSNSKNPHSTSHHPRSNSQSPLKAVHCNQLTASYSPHSKSQKSDFGRSLQLAYSPIPKLPSTGTIARLHTADIAYNGHNPKLPPSTYSSPNPKLPCGLSTSARHSSREGSLMMATGNGKKSKESKSLKKKLPAALSIGIKRNDRMIIHHV